MHEIKHEYYKIHMLIRWKHENKFDNSLWNIRWLDEAKPCVSCVFVVRFLIRMTKGTTFML